MCSSPARVRLRRLSVVDEIVTAVRAQVLDLAFPPGTALPEDAVAEMFGVSRPTARSALLALTAQGLLRREPSKPAYVPELTSRDVNDLFRVRRPVELEAVRLITRKRLPVPAAAYEAASALSGMSNDPLHVVVLANIGFHKALVAGVNNLALVRCFEALEGEVQLALSQSGAVRHAGNAATEHAALLEVLEAHRWRDARTLMLAHLKASAVEIVSAIEARRRET